MSPTVKTSNRRWVAACVVAASFALTVTACGSTGSASTSTTSQAATSTSRSTVPTSVKPISITTTTTPPGTSASEIGDATVQMSAELGALQALLGQTTADFEAGHQDS
jgi:hypothetical protein